MWLLGSLACCLSVPLRLETLDVDCRSSGPRGLWMTGSLEGTAIPLQQHLSLRIPIACLHGSGVLLVIGFAFDTNHFCSLLETKRIS